MFLVSIVRNGFLKSSVAILKPCRRNFIAKNKARWIEEMRGSSPNFEAAQNSRLTPKGFEIIYLTPLEPYIKWTYRVLPFFWILMFADAFTCYTNENYLERLQEKLGKVSRRDKILQFGLATVFIVLLQVVPLRVVMGIFRKGDEFQTLMYGFLGPLTKKYIPHGFQAMEPTLYKSVYNFNGKKVILFSNGFQNAKDFSSVIKINFY